MADSQDAGNGHVQITLDASNPLNLIRQKDPAAKLEDRLEAREGIVSKVNLSPEAQATYDLMTYILHEEEFGETPQERLETLKTVIKDGDIIRPEEIRVFRQEHERVARQGETLLYEFVDFFFLNKLRNDEFKGMAGGKRKQEPMLRYLVYANCDEHGPLDFNPEITRDDLTALRGNDYHLARAIARCQDCNALQEPTLSRLQYDFGRVDQYWALKAEAEEADEEFERKLGIQNIPQNPFENDKSPGQPYTQKERNQWKRQHGTAYDKLRKRRDARKRRFRDFQNNNDILEIYTRVKGSDRFISKVTDGVWCLDDLFEDDTKIDNTEHPNAIKDYLGVKIVVSGERAKEKLVKSLENACALMGGNMRFIGEPQDYWGEPVYEEKKDGTRKRVKGYKERDGEKAYEAWKVAIEYCGMAIEVQIQTPEMWKLDQETHDPHENRARARRERAETGYGIPVRETAAFFKELTELRAA